MLETLLLVGLLQQPVLVKNPTLIEFDSVDHSQLVAYVVDIYRASDGTPVAHLTIPVSETAVLPTGKIQIRLNVQPIRFGRYWLDVQSVAVDETGAAAELRSEASARSDNWDRVPGAPTKPVVK